MIYADQARAEQARARRTRPWLAQLASRIGIVCRDLPPTAHLLAVGVVLPNLISLVTIPFDISIPPRTGAIFLYMAVTLFARRLPYALVASLYLVALAYDLISTISLQFNLAPTEIMVALKHATTVNLFNSPLYSGLGIFIALPTAGVLALMTRRDRLRQGNMWVLLTVVLCGATIDFLGHVSPYYYFGTWLDRSKPVESAAGNSGFGRHVGSRHRNTVIVVVESMGELIDKDARDWIAAPINAPEVTARYKVTAGTAEYFGSTTAGEMRELCDRRDPYTTLTSDSGASCLPARLKRAGYTTMAFHAYSRKMFDRKDWYPLIGFDHTLFGEQMLRETHRSCGSVFRGGCDADMEGLITKAVENAGKGPFLLYWLTLNTHVPVVPADVHAPVFCNDTESRDVCIMTSMWRQVFETVGRLALDPRIAPANFLIVGDHAPPLWSARGRGMFEPGRVAWYRLAPN